MNLVLSWGWRSGDQELKYAVFIIVVTLLLILSWKLVDRHHSSEKNFLTWHKSTFDISSEKAKVKAVQEASSSVASEPILPKQTPSSFGAEYDKFLSEQEKGLISKYKKLGFSTAEQYEETLSEEYRFLADQYRQHMTQFLRNKQLSEEQISTLMAIDEEFTAQLDEIYRVRELDGPGQYEQRERARSLSSNRHAKLLEVISPGTLNSMELEKAQFYKSARETYKLRAYEYGR